MSDTPARRLPTNPALGAFRGWAGAAHPYPLSMVLLLTALIAFASAAGTPDAPRLALLLSAMLFSQLAIGWSNDYLDRAVDALHQPWKPVPSGLVPERWMPPAILSALIVSLLAGATLGVWPFVLLVVGTACGLAYNLGIKASRWSALLFVVAFTVLPLFVWTSLDVYRDEFLAIYAIAFTLPVAAHLANVLPDVDTDQEQGRRTIAVVLGRGRAIAVAMVCQFLPVPLTAASLAWLTYETAILAPAIALHVCLSALAWLLYRKGNRPADAMAFRCIALAAVVFAAGWLAAV